MMEYSPTMTLLNAKAATGIDTSINVSDWQNLLVQFGSASSANLTVKFVGSFSEACPDWTAAASVSNHWDYVGFYNLKSGVFVTGSTGVALSGTDDFQNLLINTDGLRWLSAIVTARSAGSVTVKVMGTSLK